MNGTSFSASASPDKIDCEDFFPPVNLLALGLSWISIVLNVLVIVIVILQRKRASQRQASTQLRWRPSHIHMMSLVISDLIVGINYR